jgi:hypothetical protein
MVSPGRGTTRVTGPSMSVDHNAFRNDNAEVSFLELNSSILLSIKQDALVAFSVPAECPGRSIVRE